MNAEFLLSTCSNSRSRSLRIVLNLYLRRFMIKMEFPSSFLGVNAVTLLRRVLASLVNRLLRMWFPLMLL